MTIESKIFNIFDLQGLKFLARLLLGLSHLNEQRFWHNFQKFMNNRKMFFYTVTLVLTKTKITLSFLNNNCLKNDRLNTYHLYTNLFSLFFLNSFSFHWQKRILLFQLCCMYFFVCVHINLKKKIFSRCVILYMPALFLIHVFIASQVSSLCKTSCW